MAFSFAPQLAFLAGPLEAISAGRQYADPFQFKKFHAHIAHEGKKIAEKAYGLPIDPVHELIQDCRGDKIPNKYFWSPPTIIITV